MGRKEQFYKEVKYLVMIIEQKFTWNPHVENLVNRTKMALGTNQPMAGNGREDLFFYPKIIGSLVHYHS